MAQVELYNPPAPAPEVRIVLSKDEAVALSTLLNSGTDAATLKLLGLQELRGNLMMYVGEKRNAAFGWCAEAEYYTD